VKGASDHVRCREERSAAKLTGPRKRWRAYKARVRELPDGYRTAAERYLMNFVPADSESSTAMFEDLADLFEQAAAEGTPVREVVGEDPADFVDAFAANSDGGYTPARARKQLADDLTRADNEASKATGSTP
jgi:DNA-binding ferritin-like protein (Dps family)